MGRKSKLGKNDNRPVKSPRYKMLMNFLELSKAKNDPFFHDYPEYGSFICGSQVQLDVSKHPIREF